MYDLMYQYLVDYIFTSSSLDSFATSLGMSVSLNVYLAHTTTILLMCLFVWLLIMGAYWLFKLVGGWFILK